MLDPYRDDRRYDRSLRDKNCGKAGRDKERVVVRKTAKRERSRRRRGEVRGRGGSEEDGQEGEEQEEEGRGEGKRG